MSDLITVYVAIGNSDDKLSQASWHEFWTSLRAAVGQHAAEVHGEWLSIPCAPYQNACICAAVHVEDTARLKAALSVLAGRFGQSAIAWAQAETEMVLPP